MAAALQAVQTNRGKQIMDNIRRQIATIEAEEDQLLQQRSRESRSSVDSALLTFAIANVLDLTFITLVFYLVRRDQVLRLQEEKKQHYLIDQLTVSEEQLRQMNATLEQRVYDRTMQLEASNQALEAFIYSVTHDLRAPLRRLQGLAQVLDHDYGDRLEHLGQTYIHHIVESAIDMDTLITDLLTYSQLNHAEIPLQPTDLTSVIQTALKQLDTEIQTTEIRIDASLNHSVMVLAHRPTLLQVIVNLMSNALKFVPVGKRPLIQIRSEVMPTAVKLWIIDTGIGIEPEYQTRIFRVFERLHTTQAYPGTGVGLAIVQKGIERMDGQVGVESQLGQGSQFWILLPTAPN